MTGTEFSLRNILHEASESITDADPVAVAEAAFAAIEPGDYREALHQALSMLATHYVVTHRPTRRASIKRPAKVAKPGSKSASRRVDRARRFLNSREFSPARGKWILLEEATVEDLRSMAEARYALAEATNAKGHWFERCAEEMEKVGAETFGELPDAVRDDLMYDDADEDAS